MVSSAHSQGLDVNKWILEELAVAMAARDPRQINAAHLTIVYVYRQDHNGWHCTRILLTCGVYRGGCYGPRSWPCPSDGTDNGSTAPWIH